MICLAQGNRADYRAACARLLELAKSTSEIGEMHATALTCVLDPQCVSDWDPVVRMAARCADAYEGDRRLHVAALYRAGKLDEALGHPWSPTQVRFSHIVWEGIFQGMLRLRAGRSEESRVILSETRKMVDLMDEHFPRDYASKVWSDWIYHVQCHVLRDEAEALLKDAGSRASGEPAK